MSVVPAYDRLHQLIAAHLAKARSRSDELFRLVRPSSLYERPIPERHRIIFYLGHLEAFDWNLICRDLSGLESINPAFDQLFAFGIDPTDGDLPDDKPEDWPSEEEIRMYSDRVRVAVNRCFDLSSFSRSGDDLLVRGLAFWVAIEHRLMHADTLAYMLHWLPYNQKAALPVRPDLVCPEPQPRSVEVPAGEATLGLEPTEEFPFGWDNEFKCHRVRVPAFAIDAYPVTNGRFLEFVRAGGYQNRDLWSESAWQWISAEGIQHPRFWKRRGTDWLYRTMFADLPLPLAWPVYLSHAEAEAYARWVGKSLPTESQFHRAAYGSPEGAERHYPWGSFPPDSSRGNFDFIRWTPTPVDAHPRGNSAFGVADLVGNGHEWTSTVFAPFLGFERFWFYPGYSANFFDGKHYVMKGGSPRTASVLLRRSFRNWFQPQYSYIYAKFRCVEN
jgi:iron(II)-dependent oxidoreductase